MLVFRDFGKAPGAFALAVLCLSCSLTAGKPPQHQFSSSAGSSNATTRLGTVFMKDGRAEFFRGVLNRNGAATGKFQVGLNTTGWDVLDIKAGYGKGGISDSDLLYAAGFLEGYLTADRISLNYQNLFQATFGGMESSKVQKIKDWFSENDRWVRKLVGIPMLTQRDPFLRHLSYVVAQMDGLYDGFVANHGQPADKFVVFMLNGIGDIIDLQHAILNTGISLPEWSRMNPATVKAKVRLSGHCSALIKLLPGYENLFMAHSSWFLYTSTMRIYKHYNFNLRDPATAAKKQSFSSYPGFLESLDDFYLLSSGLVMIQTTNNVFNLELYKSVVPQSVLAWQRVRVANAVARNGEEWAKAFSQYNSGTYNNQYMIVDLKRIELGRIVKDGALTIVEQIPTLVEYSDQSTVLRTGYWPSYNVPFHEKIYNLSGYPEFVKQQGLDFSYELAPRAKIFRRDANNIKNMADFQAIMRYNNYTKDPYSEHNSCDTICCRGDLLEHEQAKPDGCYDSKTADYASASRLQSWAINGPTRGAGAIKPFSWSGQFNGTPHHGLPQTYNFNWQRMQPSL